MCIAAIPWEFPSFYANIDQNLLILYNYKSLFMLAGILGFITNFAAFLVTQSLSGLYLKALGIFRNICLVGIAVILFNEVITTQQFIGYALSLVGFTYYNYIKT